jgi:hypothetical protein
VQNPDVQSASDEQAAPPGFGPQLPRTHCTPGAHWSFVVQAPKQALRVASQV